MKFDRISDIEKIKRGKRCFLHIVESDCKLHPKLNCPCCLILIFDNTCQIVGTGHSELIKLDFETVMLKIKNSFDFIFVKNIKKLYHYSEIFFNKNFHDIEILKYCSGKKIEEKYKTKIFYHIETLSRNKYTNLFVPISKHIEEIVAEYSGMEFPTETELLEPGYVGMRQTIIPSIAFVEKSGISIDVDVFLHHFGEEQRKNILNGKVYNLYNMWSLTGRPSNSFDGVNYAAMNKEDGSRKSIVSENGNLVMFDFKAYHPRLIAKLSNAEIPNVDDLYVWLIKQILKRNEISKDEIREIKGDVFAQIYGHIKKENLNIPYFKSIQNYINLQWDLFNTFGHVQTPIFRRSITSDYIEDPFPNKVTNYILQAYETERNCVLLRELEQILKNMNTKIIHYMYDSFLFDVDITEETEILKRIKSCLCENDKFPVSIKIGKNFHEMLDLKI